MRAIALTILLTASLSACGTFHRDGSDGLTARTDGSRDFAERAQKHCQQYGKGAVFVAVEPDLDGVDTPGGGRYVRYDCVPVES